MILALNIFSVSKCFISFGRMFRKETDSVPYLTAFTLPVFQKLFSRKLQLQFFPTKISFKQGAESPYRIFNVSMAIVLMFLWCIVTMFSLSSKSWKMMTCCYK